MNTYTVLGPNAERLVFQAGNFVVDDSNDLSLHNQDDLVAYFPAGSWHGVWDAAAVNGRPGEPS